MLIRTLATVAVAVGALLTSTAVASAAPADDPYGFNEIRDRTDYFVTPLEPGALFGDKSSRPLILSPYGTSQKIECRGDGHYVQIHDCVQYTPDGAAHSLIRIDIVRQIYLFL